MSGLSGGFGGRCKTIDTALNAVAMRRFQETQGRLNAYARQPGLTLSGQAKPSNVRTFWADILTFDGFFGANFDILKPRWLPTPGNRLPRNHPLARLSGGRC
jgi:hypothetical protein